MHKVKLPNVSVDPGPGYCSKSEVYNWYGYCLTIPGCRRYNVWAVECKMLPCHFPGIFKNVFFFIEIATRHSFLQDRQNLIHHRNGFVKNKVGNNVINAVIFENSSEPLQLLFSWFKLFPCASTLVCCFSNISGTLKLHFILFSIFSYTYLLHILPGPRNGCFRRKRQRILELFSPCGSGCLGVPV